MELVPTSEQQRVIDEPSHCVVIARPGSGKTATLAWKIKKIIPTLPPFRGVIAISYTNKASDELKRKALQEGIDSSTSFFGTIDRFYLAEIILPFAKHVWGLPERQVEIKKLEEINEGIDSGCQQWNSRLMNRLGELYHNGTVILEMVGHMAVYLFDKVLSCRKYLRARYSHVIVDEYQDCGNYQHLLFERLVENGLTGIAVGDLDQSIFAFAGKDSRFLESLTNDKRFKPYTLTQNHRSHASIVAYSLKFISNRIEMEQADEKRVFYKNIDGSEIEIARWISESVKKMEKDFNIATRREIGILTKSRQTANIIHKSLSIAHKAIVSTPLDEISASWGSLFRRVLFITFDENRSLYELVEEYFDVASQQRECRLVLDLLGKIRETALQPYQVMSDCLPMFIQIADTALPEHKSKDSIQVLSGVLSNRWQLESFVPPMSDQVQLMTLHKSKGLEFDAVFHLDLYKYILPQYKTNNIRQEENLHYVGITRAKKCCILCLSTKRHKKDGTIIRSEPSEFLCRDGLDSIRLHCPF